MNKRAIVLGVLDRIGFLRLWRSRASDRLLVVNYHRILDGAANNPFDDGVVTCTPDVLDAQLEMLTRYRTIVSMHDFVASLEGGPALPPRPTLITFDDGYADNFEIAFPILKKYSAPACFYLPAKRLQERELEWWDHIACAVKRADTGVRSVEFGGLTIDTQLDSAEGQRAATDELIGIAKETGADVESLYGQLNAERPDKSVESGQIMTDEQVREILAEPGFAIGAHSVSHAVLTTLDDDGQAFELRESRRFLEARFDVPVRTFAYPVGDDAHYNDVSRRMARSAGYACAFNFRRAARDVRVDELKPFDIDRICAPRRADAIFAARASGFFAI
ncbi:MAG: polysaccharide deacetylase family protein [Woeseiaceae bacterium]|nr:polysaccharide deacetylase family protein [Woeseiaceae bacterium]